MSAVVKSQPALLHRERYQCYQWQLDITRNPASKALRHGPTRDNYVSNSQSASNWWHCTQEIRYDARPSKSKSSEKPTSGHMSRVDLRMAMEMARHYTHWFAITVLALLWGAGIPGPTLAGHHQGSTKMSSKTRMLMKYYDIKICDNVLHYFRISKVGYRMVGGADVVDADGFMDVEIKSIKMLIIQLHRCLGGIGPNQCEYFTRMGWSTGLCELAVAKNMIWTPFVDKITPTFKCPAAACTTFVFEHASSFSFLETLDGVPYLHLMIPQHDVVASQVLSEMVSWTLVRPNLSKHDVLLGPGANVTPRCSFYGMRQRHASAGQRSVRPNRHVPRQLAESPETCRQSVGHLRL
ncbi:uncharacterized protein LOC113217125 isoform X1 [Frankliniella occidentalis]|uniref:Uncharacterized protein LOC113217125 isoform X1 n=1 Tax=Frankliniella occidentalis TaxID=133901 RepID=A0A9C6XBZ2_FRAOC|nr:uncharacterized protein LOC113217125 isoform X1 [Frankliniella occidentalis]